jgi:hypothetical protein
MKKYYIATVNAILFLSATTVNAHGLHVQELAQGAGGVTHAFLHLFIEHGYWMLFLVAGYGLFLYRRIASHRSLQQGRGGQRRNDHHQNDGRE